MLPTVPQAAAPPTAAGLAAVAAGAERAGAGGVWACDHLFWHGPVVECLTALGVAAAATERCTIGSAVLQLPLRDAGVVAKQAASLQDLSAGRFVLGLGVGSHPGEYEAAGRDYAARGRRLDAQVADLRSLWSGGLAAHPGGPVPAADAGHGAAPHDATTGSTTTGSGTTGSGTTGGTTTGSTTTGSGTTGSTDEARYRQRPVAGDVPVWFGGSSPAALDRAARLGDGWMPLFLAPDEYHAALGSLSARREDAGRDPGTLVASIVVFVSLAGGAPGAAGRALDRGAAWMSSLYRLPPRAFARHLVAGTARECAARVARWVEAGADHVVAFVTDDAPLVQFEDLATALADILGDGPGAGLAPAGPRRGTVGPSTALPSDGAGTWPARPATPVARTPADRTTLAATPGPS